MGLLPPCWKVSLVCLDRLKWAYLLFQTQTLLNMDGLQRSYWSWCLTDHCCVTAALNDFLAVVRHFFLRLPFTQKETLKKVVWQISQVSGPWCSRSQHIDECDVCVANRSEAASISQPQDTVVESARWSDWELGPGGWRQKVHLRLLYHLVLPTREYALTGLACARVRPLHPYLLSNLDQDRSGIW